MASKNRRRPTPIRKVLASMTPDNPPRYPVPFMNVVNNRRASVAHWADSHLAYCHTHFRY